MRHEHHDVTVATLHAHLDHDSCIESASTVLMFAGLLNLIRIRHSEGLASLLGARIAANALTFPVTAAAAWDMRAELLSNAQVLFLLVSSFGEILLSARGA